MAAKIVTQILDRETGKYTTHASFDNVDAFLSDAAKFQQGDGSNLLQVHIPGGFVLSPDDVRRINELGIKKF